MKQNCRLLRLGI